MNVQEVRVTEIGNLHVSEDLDTDDMLDIINLIFQQQYYQALMLYKQLKWYINICAEMQYTV